MTVLEEGARSSYLSTPSLAADLPLEVWDRILVEALVCPDWDGVYADQYRALVQVIRPSLFVSARHIPSSEALICCCGCCMLLPSHGTV